MIIYILCIFVFEYGFCDAKEVPTKMEKLFHFAEEVLSGPDVDSLSCAAKKILLKNLTKLLVEIWPITPLIMPSMWFG